MFILYTCEASSCCLARQEAEGVWSMCWRERLHFTCFISLYRINKVFATWDWFTALIFVITITSCCIGLITLFIKQGLELSPCYKIIRHIKIVNLDPKLGLNTSVLYLPKWRNKSGDIIKILLRYWFQWDYQEVPFRGGTWLKMSLKFPRTFASINLCHSFLCLYKSLL